MSGEPDLVQQWRRLIRRRWRTGVAMFGTVMILGIAFLFLTRPVYRSEASLKLGDPPPSSGVNPTGGILSFFQPGGDPFANDLQVLGSRSLAEGVVERMALTARLGGPAGWYRDSLLTELRTSRETDRARYAIRHVDDGRVEVLRTSPTDSAIATAPSGVPMAFGGITVAFRPWREGMPRSFDIETVPFRRATREARSALRYERAHREANVVEIAYDHPDPGVANGVMTAAVAEFVRLRTRLQRRESSESADSLRTVARATGRELRAAEDSLERFEQTYRLIAPEPQSEALVERQAELLGRLARARSELRSLDPILDRLDADRDPSSAWTALLGHPAFVQNGTLGSILVGLTELRGRRAELAARRTPDNTQLRILDDQIRYLDRSLREMAREYRAGLTAQIEATEVEAAELDALIVALPAQTIEFGRRQRQVRLLAEVLLLTEQRLRQEELREALTYATVQVVDPPALRDRPIWPRKKLGLAVLFLLASGFGLVGMAVRDRTDSRVRRAGQIQDALGRPVLAVVGPAPGDTFQLDRAELETLARWTGAARNGGAMSLVPAGREGPVRKPSDTVPELRIHGPIHGFRDAARVAREDAPTVLLVEAGRTTRAELDRTASLIEQAGGAVAGAILICATERDARQAWG